MHNRSEILLKEPELLQTVKGLEFLAKKAVDNFRSGIHKSLISGEGVEFSQLHQYQPGDDIRKVDWKKFARSERLYIRQAEMESRLKLNLFLDSSGSMNYSENRITKFDFSKFLIASLALLAFQQGDEVSLIQVVQDHIGQTEVFRSMKDFRPLLEKLMAMNARDTIDHPESFHLNGKKENTFSIVATDLWEENEEWKSWLKYIATASAETMLFHIKAIKEYELDFEKQTQFQHLETGRKIHVNTQAARQKYRTNIERYVNQWKIWLSRNNIQYVPVWTHESPRECLYALINLRKKQLG